MLNYYDEIKEQILEVLEIEEEYKEIINQATDKDEVYNELYDRFFVKDAITGNASGSYYCNAYKARKQCYNFSSDVIEALEGYGYEGKLELFKIFEALADEGYLNVDTMEINSGIFEEEEEATYRYYLEEIEGLSFETIDVITRCYLLGEVLSDVLDNYLD